MIFYLTVCITTVIVLAICHKGQSTPEQLIFTLITNAAILAGLLYFTGI